MRTFVATITLALLMGCGQTGPLYLPGEEPPTRSNPRDGTASGTAAAPAVDAPAQTEPEPAPANSAD